MHKVAHMECAEDAHFLLHVEWHACTMLLGIYHGQQIVDVTAFCLHALHVGGFDI